MVNALKNAQLAKVKRWADNIGDPYRRIAPMAAESYSDEQAAKARG